MPDFLLYRGVRNRCSEYPTFNHRNRKCNTMLSPHQQQRLKVAVRPLIDSKHQATENAQLELVIAEIKQQSPEKFHTKATLHDRVFVNEPRQSVGQVPRAGYIHFCP